MSKPKVLDLFCKAGGCSRGYEMAGFEPVGVDIEKQKRYPYEFIQADAIDFLRWLLYDTEMYRPEWGTHSLLDFSLIHASPPCQRFSQATRTSGKDPCRHPDLIPIIRGLLLQSGKAYVIENVPKAPLSNPVMICGSGVGLMDIQRHRMFESNFPLRGTECRHHLQLLKWPPNRSDRLKNPGAKARVISVAGHQGSGVTADVWRQVMGIDWMTRDELAQAIPPAYTKFLGEQIMRILASPTHSPFHRLEP